MTAPSVPLQAAPRAGGLARALEERADEILPRYLPGRRWFGGKARRLSGASLLDWADSGGREPVALLAVWEVRFQDGGRERYHLPVAARPRAAAPVSDWLAVLEAPRGRLALYDAFADPAFCRHYLELLAGAARLAGRRGRFQFQPIGRLPGPTGPVRSVRAEQSNTSVIYGREVILKAFRRIPGGLNPEVEVARFLTERTSFTGFPRALGHASYQSAGFQATVAFAQAFVPNRGDGWSHFLAGLQPYYAGGQSRGLAADARRLGQLTGEMHLALASDATDPDFAPRPLEEGDFRRWLGELERSVASAFAQLAARRRTDSGEVEAQVREAMAGRERLLEALRSMEPPDPDVVKIRIHGDYHLGQVLRTADDFVVIDFEGEPARPLEERRARQPALRDVAGMLRSFNYAAWAGWFEHGRSDPALVEAAVAWDGRMRQAYWEGYRTTVGDAPLLPRSEAAQRRLLALFELDKLVYELGYELNSRPAWLRIPLRGLLATLERL